MAVKKSELYSLLWEACNKLRGGVEPARYKDYVLVLLFFKYVSDRYKGQKFAEFTISKGASFEDLIEAKGKSDVGERADKIIQKFLEDNQLIGSLPDVSFNNADELGSGKELVDKVSGLIGVFQNPAIDFKNNRASGDDIIGDAYEYFMMKFAQESGKSKGQFYTPSEVSRIIARLIGIADIKESPNKKWTLYDPAAGSGSLLIRAADEAPVNANGDSIVTIFGQESDRATAGLAKMNLILHQKGTGEIQRGNTLSSPKFIDEFGELKKFDFIVMNPPFSDKDWSDGIKTTEDEYKRFDGYGIPPEKNGDYAWFLHVLKSLDSNGKAGFVMPHGVLFRGNSEETIRQQILKKRYIKAIISLPANLFYGTGIPACIIILDKENTDTREDIFLIDASRGFKKDGNKNRLREQDIEKIVQTYTNRVEIKGYSKIVKYTDVLDENTNNGNLNVPRYIQKIDETLPQNIAAHLKGGIPETDIESLEKLWNIAPELKNIIFKCIDEVHKVYHLALASSEIESAIGEDINILAEKDNEIIKLFSAWKNSVKNYLDVITVEDKSDPYVSEMLSIGGYTVKNNLGGVVPYVIVRTNQKEVDSLLGSISETAPSAPKSGDFWYKIDHTEKNFKLGSYSNTTSSSASSISYAIPVSWCNAVTDDIIGAASITGQVLFGGKVYKKFTANLTVSVPDTVIPSISSVTFSDVDDSAVPSSWGIYVQGQSGLKLKSISCTGAYGSEIKKVKMTADSRIRTTDYPELPEMDHISQSGEVSVMVTVTDSRNRTVNKSAVVSVVSYASPKLSSVKSERCNASGETDNDGTYFLSTTSAVFPSCLGKNALTLTVKYKRTDLKNYGNEVQINPGSNVCANNDLDPEYSCDVLYTLSDEFNTVTYSDFVSTAVYLMHFLHGGRTTSRSCS